jgi:acetyl-CoA carboxylase carboxyl transferase subunit beta
VAREIARTMATMTELDIPTVSVCVGEGGSGGALALAAADRLLVQRHAFFSVIAPEGAAAILHRDAARAAEVAEQLRLTSVDLLELGIVDGVVGESQADVATAVDEALANAQAGERHRRFDAATERALR